MSKKDDALKLAMDWYDSGNENPDDFANMIKQVIALSHAPEVREQPAYQEPVAWMWKDGTVTTDPDRADGTWIPLYTSPPASKPWVGLSTDEIYDMYNEPRSDAEMVEFARAIEAKLREKNEHMEKNA